MSPILLGVLIVLGTIILAVSSVLMYIAFPLSASPQGYDFDKDMAFDVSLGEVFDMQGEEFKILMLTDQHYNSVILDNKTDKLADKMVEQTNPDMIVLLGDQAFTPFNQNAYKHLIAKMDSYKIPWAPIFGNHDAQGKAQKEYLADLLLKSKYCIFRYGPNIGGAGNYFVNIKNGSDFVHTIYLVDSREKNGGYQPPTEEQLKWYEWAVNGMTALGGGLVPSTLMLHIPLPEYVVAYEEAKASNTVLYGEKRERECPSDPNVGMFELMKSLGSTKGMFCGHDHTNDYSVMYQGIRLSYSVSSGFGTYGNKDIKGGTLLTILTDGTTTQQPLYF
ncbi:MAG: metallophosphoesterase [Christensenellaceae bacterium]|nr:metallophosphoesterase [Christensenellaceae bacterium]